MTIKNKLYYAFAAILLLFSLSMASFFIIINDFRDFTEVKIGNSMKEADLVQTLLNENNLMIQVIDEVLLIVNGMDVGHEMPFITVMQKDLEKLVEHTSELGKHIKYCQVLYKKDDAEVRHFGRIENSINNFTKKTNHFIQMWHTGQRKADIIQYYQKNLHTQSEDNRTLLKSQYKQSFGEVVEQQEQFKTLLANGQKVIVMSAIVIFIIVFVIIYRAAKFISTPLENLKEQAIAISKGQYETQIKITSKDEIGQLSEAFNHMAVTISKEMAERKHAEEAQRRSQKMDAIGQLTGGIAHDFNNIIGIILGNIELLEKYVSDDEKVFKRLQTIKKAGLRASNLTKQLLSFARREATQVDKININQAINDMTEIITRSLTPEIEVKYLLAKDLCLTEIDVGDLEDTLLNLSINARDSIPGHGKLTIETHNSDLDEAFCNQDPWLKPGQYVELVVSDTGDGIAPELTDRIFEPFFTTKDTGKGTGLGLAMVYAFVKRSNGFIKCDSKVGVGTTFHIYLPKVNIAEVTSEQNNKKTDAMPHGKETILVVDDEKDLVGLAKDMLEGQGYRVVTATDGKQALEQLEQNPDIDLLFSDIVMPNGMNGYELAEQATAKRPDIKVLLTSGFTDKADPHKEQLHFSNGMLNKPYRQTDLAKQIRIKLDAA